MRFVRDQYRSRFTWRLPVCLFRTKQNRASTACVWAALVSSAQGTPPQPMRAQCAAQTAQARPASMRCRVVLRSLAHSRPSSRSYRCAHCVRPCLHPLPSCAHAPPLSKRRMFIFLSLLAPAGVAAKSGRVFVHLRTECCSGLIKTANGSNSSR